MTRVAVRNAVWDCPHVEGTDKLVLLCLAEHINDKTGDCFPGFDRLAILTGLHRRSVIRCIKNLESSGWLLVRRGSSAGKTVSNRYLFPMEKFLKGANVPPLMLRGGGNKCQEGVTTYPTGVTISSRISGNAPPEQYEQGIEQVINNRVTGRHPFVAAVSYDPVEAPNHFDENPPF